MFQLRNPWRLRGALGNAPAALPAGPPKAASTIALHGLQPVASKPAEASQPRCTGKPLHPCHCPIPYPPTPPPPACSTAWFGAVGVFEQAWILGEEPNPGKPLVPNSIRIR